MKSTVLVGTLAATLVSTLHADVFVLGASWKERSIATDADGAIDRKVRNVAAPRGYFIMERGVAPALSGAFIKYSNDRQDGKTYTVTNVFTNFSADIVEDESGSTTRIFGQAGVPVTTADVPNATMSFSGSTFGGIKPNRVVFDREVFQSGNSTAIAAPNIVTQSDMARSILTGTGINVPVTALTKTAAVNELIGRLEADGYERNAVAPIIVTDPPATVQRVGFDATQVLSVTLGPDVFPAPTYQWFKGVTVVGTNSTFTIPGGAAGDGTYHVVVTTAAGSDTSTDTVVPASTPVAMSFSPALPASISVKADAFAPMTATVNANALPQVVGYQWTKSTTGAAGAYTNVPTANGGNLQTLQVTGAALSPTGPGHYKVIVSNGTATTLTNAVPIQVIAIP